MFLNNFHKKSECFFKFNTCKLRFLRTDQLKRYLNEDICTKNLTEIYRKCKNGEMLLRLRKGAHIHAKEIIMLPPMGVVALIRKNTEVLGSAGHYNLCRPEYLGGFFIFGWWLGRYKVATSWCGKINWVVIRIKLCWSDYKLMLPMLLEKAFSEFIDFPIYSSAFIYLFIDIFIDSLIYLSLNEFCKFF